MLNETEERYDIELDTETKTTLDTNRANDLAEVDSMYGAYDSKTGKFTGGLGGQIDSVANQQISNIKSYEEEQARIQQEQTDHTINQINQQKEQAGQDYIKEGAGAYSDYQKAINPYGVNAEKMAEQGLIGGGYSESSRVTMYNTYQNRVVSARKVYSDAVLNYNNAIKDAQIANSATLAEIAFKSMQSQLELSMNALNMKGELIAQMADQKLAINTRHDNLYQTELDRLYKQYSLNETARQHDETLAEDKRQFDQGQENWKAEYEESVRQFNKNQENWKSEFEWKQETDERDYNRAVAESDRAFTETQRVNNASIQSDNFNKVMKLIDAGADDSITDTMLTNAGLTRDTLNGIIHSRNTLKESSKSATEFSNRMALATMVLEGYVPTDKDYAAAGLTDYTSKQQFKEYISAVEKSAILEDGSPTTASGSLINSTTGHLMGR